MNVFSLLTGALLFALFIWAGILFVVWAYRPAAAPTHFLCALACVGICIVCVLAGMSTLNGEGAAFVSQAVYLVVGLGALLGGAHQSFKLYQARHFTMDSRVRKR
jgi:hypothetical protein